MVLVGLSGKLGCYEGVGRAVEWVACQEGVGWRSEEILRGMLRTVEVPGVVAGISGTRGGEDNGMVRGQGWQWTIEMGSGTRGSMDDGDKETVGADE